MLISILALALSSVAASDACPRIHPTVALTIAANADRSSVACPAHVSSCLLFLHFVHLCRQAHYYSSTLLVASYNPLWARKPLPLGRAIASCGGVRRFPLSLASP